MTEKTTKYYSLQVVSQERIYNFLTKISVFASDKIAQDFIHSIIDQICGRIVSFDRFINEENERIVNQLIRVYSLFINRVVGRDLKKEYICEDLKTANVDGLYINVIADCIISRFTDIKRELTEKLSTISSSSLSDFDWKMNAILSSDRINIVQENVLLLNLTIETNHNDKKEQVLIELTKKELDHILEVFDQINDVIQSLKV
ncbi:hypothetical protein DICPUDRAFT_150605 [Dictyostelium purpureum]|uniref:COMM domain-containing protein n=1 Tax=Dictyostelium purpureum TaxID=5786 RepID=F0ZGS1_DICPU|nr:uncharacterized protein DICPUDRAFT_150605 [Dictyostelium purpureum]EGC36894.1 hypothetical protein DICPUDRAFT_150605 [Dictyostelium purpureum]|eukprot:XP_003286616.1 hypothetical protein DICPUDRAFT_150605 [Dictyostelium purpureum]